MNSQQLDKLHKKELDILKVFIEVCEKLNIKYFAICGTALGAVRHKGFIPWDDDIDVAMTRKDFTKLCQNAQKLLPEHYFLQCRESDPYYNINHAKLRDSNTTFLEPGWENRQGHQGIFIDIFPWDYFPTKGFNAIIFKIRKKYYQNIIATENHTNYWKKNGLKNKIRAILQPFINWLYPNRHKVAEKLDKLICELKPMPNVGSHGSSSTYFNADGYKQITKLPFEDIMINVPIGIHEHLTICYGDYMKLPPKEQQTPLHFGGIIDTERPYTYYTEKPLS